MPTDDGDRAFSGFSVAREVTAPSFTSCWSSSFWRRLYAFTSTGDICFTPFSFSQTHSRRAGCCRHLLQGAATIRDQGFTRNHLGFLQVTNVLVNLGRFTFFLGSLTAQSGQQIVDDSNPLIDKAFEPGWVSSGHVPPESFIRGAVTKEISGHLRDQQRLLQQLLQPLLTGSRVSDCIQLWFVQEVLSVSAFAFLCHVREDTVNA